MGWTSPQHPSDGILQFVWNGRLYISLITVTIQIKGFIFVFLFFPLMIGSNILGSLDYVKTVEQS